MDARHVGVTRVLAVLARAATVTTPKSHQYRSLTLGQATVELWHAQVERWPARGTKRRLAVRADAGGATFVQPRGLAARFERLRDLPTYPTRHIRGWNTARADHLDRVFNRQANRT